MQAVTIDRDKYIGGSDIPIILGISHFKSRFDLLLEKAGLQENEFTGNEYTEYGNILEPKIRNYINKQKISLKPFREDKKVVGDVRCHVDGFNGETVLEIKTTSQIHNNVDDYKVYLVQLLFYMQTMNVEKGLLAVYERPKDFGERFDSKRLQTYYIDINNYKDLIEQINKAVDQFRIDLDKIKKNPFMTEEELLPVDLSKIANELSLVEEQLIQFEILNEKKKQLLSELKQAMKNNSIKKWVTNSGNQITLVDDGEDKKILKFNESKFKDENKELYEKYLETKIQKGRAGYVKITLKKEDNIYE